MSTTTSQSPVTTIEQTHRLPAPRDRVFAELTNPAEASRWLAQQYIGGEFRVS